MTISRKKFVIAFILCGFACMAITTTLLGSTGPRGFPKQPDSLLHTGADSGVVWKETVSLIIFPIKIILIGPLALPSVNILKEDPPPPFIGLYLIVYWTLIAGSLHYLLVKIKQ